MLCSECTQLVYELVETDTLDSSEACVEISTRHIWLWPEICLRCRHEIAGICRCRLGREHSGPEEHIWFLFTLGSAMVSWCSRKHTSVALSNAEAEYIALCVAVCEAMWLRKLLADLFGHEMDSIVIHCDKELCEALRESCVSR
jgi:hypothetical protein